MSNQNKPKFSDKIDEFRGVRVSDEKAKQLYQQESELLNSKELSQEDIIDLLLKDAYTMNLDAGATVVSRDQDKKQKEQDLEEGYSKKWWEPDTRAMGNQFKKLGQFAASFTGTRFGNSWVDRALTFKGPQWLKGVTDKTRDLLGLNFPEKYASLGKDIFDKINSNSADLSKDEKRTTAIGEVIDEAYAYIESKRLPGGLVVDPKATGLLNLFQTLTGSQNTELVLGRSDIVKKSFNISIKKIEAVQQKDDEDGTQIAKSLAARIDKNTGFAVDSSRGAGLRAPLQAIKTVLSGAMGGIDTLLTRAIGGTIEAGQTKILSEIQSKVSKGEMTQAEGDQLLEARIRTSAAKQIEQEGEKGHKWLKTKALEAINFFVGARLIESRRGGVSADSGIEGVYDHIEKQMEQRGRISSPEFSSQKTEFINLISQGRLSELTQKQFDKISFALKPEFKKQVEQYISIPINGDLATKQRLGTTIESISSGADSEIWFTKENLDAQRKQEIADARTNWQKVATINADLQADLMKLDWSKTGEIAKQYGMGILSAEATQAVLEGSYNFGKAAIDRQVGGVEILNDQLPTRVSDWAKNRFTPNSIIDRNKANFFKQLYDGSKDVVAGAVVAAVAEIDTRGFELTGKKESRGTVLVNGQKIKIEINSLHTDQNEGLSYNGLNIKGLTPDQLQDPKVRAQVLNIIRDNSLKVSLPNASIIEHSRSGLQLVKGLESRSVESTDSKNDYVFIVAGQEIKAGSSGQNLNIDGKLVTVLGSSIDADGKPVLVVIPTEKALRSKNNTINIENAQFVQYSEKAAEKGAVGTVEPPKDQTVVVAQASPEPDQRPTDVVLPLAPEPPVVIAQAPTSNSQTLFQETAEIKPAVDPTPKPVIKPYNPNDDQGVVLGSTTFVTPRSAETSSIPKPVLEANNPKSNDTSTLAQSAIKPIPTPPVIPSEKSKDNTFTPELKPKEAPTVLAGEPKAPITAKPLNNGLPVVALPPLEPNKANFINPNLPTDASKVAASILNTPNGTINPEVRSVGDAGLTAEQRTRLSQLDRQSLNPSTSKSDLKAIKDETARILGDAIVSQNKALPAQTIVTEPKTTIKNLNTAPKTNLVTPITINPTASFNGQVWNSKGGSLATELGKQTNLFKVDRGATFAIADVELVDAKGKIVTIKQGEQVSPKLIAMKFGLKDDASNLSVNIRAKGDTSIVAPLFMPQQATVVPNLTTQQVAANIRDTATNTQFSNLLNPLTTRNTPEVAALQKSVEVTQSKLTETQGQIDKLNRQIEGVQSTENLTQAQRAERISKLETARNKVESDASSLRYRLQFEKTQLQQTVNVVSQEPAITKSVLANIQKDEKLINANLRSIDRANAQIKSLEANRSVPPAEKAAAIRELKLERQKLVDNLSQSQTNLESNRSLLQRVSGITERQRINIANRQQEVAATTQAIRNANRRVDSYNTQINDLKNNSTLSEKQKNDQIRDLTTQRDTKLAQAKALETELKAKNAELSKLPVPASIIDSPSNPQSLDTSLKAVDTKIGQQQATLDKAYKSVAVISEIPESKRTVQQKQELVLAQQNISKLPAAIASDIRTKSDLIRGSRDADEARLKSVNGELAKLDPKNIQNLDKIAKLKQELGKINNNIAAATKEIEVLRQSGVVIPVEQQNQSRIPANRPGGVFGIDIKAENNALLTLAISEGEFTKSLDNKAMVLADAVTEMEKLKEESYISVAKIASLAKKGEPLPDNLKNLTLPKGVNGGKLYEELIKNPSLTEDLLNNRVRLVAVSNLKVEQTERSSGLIIPSPALIFASFGGKSTYSMLVVGDSQMASTNSQGVGIVDRRTGAVVSAEDFRSKLEIKDGKATISIPGIKLEGVVNNENKLEVVVDGKKYIISNPETIAKIKSNKTFDASIILDDIRKQDPNNSLFAGYIDVSKAVDPKSMMVTINGAQTNLNDVIASTSRYFYQTKLADGSTLQNSNVAKSVVDRENVGLFVLMLNSLPPDQAATLLRQVRNAANETWGVNDYSNKSETQRYFKGVADTFRSIAPDLLTKETIYSSDVVSLMTKINFDAVSTAIEAAKPTSVNTYNEINSRYQRYLVGNSLPNFNPNKATAQELAEAIQVLRNGIKNNREANGFVGKDVDAIIANGTANYETMKARINYIQGLLGQNQQTMESSSTSSIGFGFDGLTGQSRNVAEFNSGVRSSQENSGIERMLKNNPDIKKVTDAISFIGIIPINGYTNPLINKAVVAIATNFLPAMAAGGVQTEESYSKLSFTPEQLSEIKAATELGLDLLNNDQVARSFAEKLKGTGNNGLSPRDAFSSSISENVKLSQSDSKYWVDFQGKRYPFGSEESRSKALQSILKMRQEIQADVISSEGRTSSTFTLLDSLRMISAIPDTVEKSTLESAARTVVDQNQKAYYQKLLDADKRLSSESTFANLPKSGQELSGEQFKSKYGYDAVGMGRFGDGKGGIENKGFVVTGTDKINIVGEDANYTYAYIVRCENNLVIPKPNIDTVTLGESTSTFYTPTTQRSTWASFKQKIVDWNISIGFKLPQPKPPEPTTPETPKVPRVPEVKVPTKPTVVSQPPQTIPQAPTPTPTLNIPGQPVTPPTIPNLGPQVGVPTPLPFNSTVVPVTPIATPAIATTAPANLGSSVVFNQAAASQAVVAPIAVTQAPAAVLGTVVPTQAVQAVQTVVAPVTTFVAPITNGVAAVANTAQTAAQAWLPIAGSTAPTAASSLSSVIPTLPF